MELLKSSNVLYNLLNFFLISGGMLLGTLIAKMYQGLPIFPTLNKSISSSIGVTILYLTMEHFAPFDIDPYGDLVLCTTLGLFAESLLGRLIEKRGGLLNIAIPLVLKHWFKVNQKVIDDIGKELIDREVEKEASNDETVTDKETAKITRETEGETPKTKRNLFDDGEF